MFVEKDLVVREYNSRQELRRIVVLNFLEENPGLGSGEKASRYRYNVETLSDGRRIYLTRPAYLKKGFDFRINVENTTFMTGKEYPKHDDIFNDVRIKKQEDLAAARRLLAVISEVYGCKDPQDLLAATRNLRFSTGHPVELVLKVIKWFLIEQDIRDWNYSGRKMFWDGINTALS